MVRLQRGEFPLAITALERSLAIRTSVLGPDTSEVASTLEQLALAQIRLERFPEAENRLAQSQRIRERSAEQAAGALAQTLELVGLLRRYTDNYPAALTAIDRALEIQRRLAPRHPDEIFALQTRGDVLLLMGDASGAEQDWKSALELATRTLRADHPLVAETLGRLSLAAFSLGNLAEARRLAERARDIGDRSLAPCDPAGPVLAVALADALRYNEQSAEARKLYRGTLEKVRGCDNSGATAGWTDAEATLVFNDAGVAQDVGDLVEADELYTRAVDIWSKALGPNHSFVARGLDAVADVAAARGDLPRAHNLYERALTIRRRSLGPDHPHVAWTLTNLAKTEADLGNVLLALRYVQDAIAIYRKSGTGDEPDHLARVPRAQKLARRATRSSACGTRERRTGDSGAHSHLRPEPSARDGDTRVARRDKISHSEIAKRQ